MRTRLLFGVALLAMAATAQAATLTIDDAVEKALAANPRAQAAALEALAAGRRQAEAKSRHFGKLDVIGNYGHFESPRLVRPMSIDLFTNPAGGFGQLPWDANQVHYGVAFEIPLLAGGSLREGDRIAALARSAAQRTASFTREEVRYGVRTAYRGALLAHHALAAAEAYREALTRDEADFELKVKVGSLPAVEAAKVAFALRGAEAKVASLAARERTSQAILAAFMGEEPPPDGYELANVTAEPPEPDTAGALADALAGRTDLAAVREATHIAERKKVLARQSFGPYVSLQGNWLRNDAPSLEHALDTHELYLMVRLPLFEGMRRVHALEEAKINLRAARQRERGKALEVSAQVSDAEGRVEAALALLEAGKSQRVLGAEVARVEHLKLEQGTGKMEDYLTARAQELQGETSYWQGLYALQDAVDYFHFVTARGGQHE